MGKGLVVGVPWVCRGRLGPLGGGEKEALSFCPLSAPPLVPRGTLEGFLGEGFHHSPTCLYSVSIHC